jgi:hypothetical protein
MSAEHSDYSHLNSLPHPDDEKVLAIAREALLTDAVNVFILADEDFHLDACFLAFYQQLKQDPRLTLHRMMSPKAEEIVELFNGILGDLSIEEARNQMSDERHVIVMPDFGPSAGKEWVACESLVNTFPGANARLLAFSTMGGHDPEVLRQISLKSRSKVLHLGLMDEQAMRVYLSECHHRGELAPLLPALQEAGWSEMAMEISGQLAEGELVQSVSAYQEKVVAAAEAEEAPVADAAAVPTESEVVQRETRVWWPVIKSTMVAVFIALTAGLVVLAVAGALHPPLWESLEAALVPLYDRLMSVISR